MQSPRHLQFDIQLRCICSDFPLNGMINPRTLGCWVSASLFTLTVGRKFSWDRTDHSRINRAEGLDT